MDGRPVVFGRPTEPGLQADSSAACGFDLHARAHRVVVEVFQHVAQVHRVIGPCAVSAASLSTRPACTFTACIHVGTCAIAALAECSSLPEVTSTASRAR